MKGVRPPKPESAEHVGFGTDIWAMIQQCWDADREQRLSAHAALQATIIAQLHRRLYPVAFISNQGAMYTGISRAAQHRQDLRIDGQAGHLFSYQDKVI